MPSAEPGPATGPTVRRDLETRQQALVAALVAGAYPPAGMDGRRIAIQAAARLRTRGRAVARTWPELAAALGPAFGRYFEDYTTTSGGPAPGGSAADGRAFARYLLGISRRGMSREVIRAARRAARSA
jgi:hypothetical protein